MTTSEAQTTAIPEATPTQEQANTYPMSKDGRRQAIVLLLGVVSIWVFALWSLVTLLEEGLTGIEWISSLLMLGIMVVSPVVGWALLEEANSRVSTDDRGIRYTTLGGINVTYAWDDLLGFEQSGRRGRITRFFLGEKEESNVQGPTSKEESEIVRQASNNDGAGDVKYEDDGETEPGTLLLRVREDRTAQIGNPIFRFLHSLAHGPHLPIYGGLENRHALLAEIAARHET